MKIDGRFSKMSSWLGFLCTLMILIVIALYAYLKAWILLQRKDVKLVQIMHDSHHSAELEFGYENGLNIAAAFSAYDNQRERILDPSYGELVFMASDWRLEADGTTTLNRKILESHPCTRAELGLEED